MPDKIAIPENGDIYEAIEDFDITYKTTHLASFADTGTARFPAGERLKIDTCGKNRINVYCDPVNYETLEHRIVPEKIRTSVTYDGYYFYIAVTTLHDHCRRII